MAFALSPFAPRKQITEHFNGNIAIFNVCKLGHSDVIVIKLTAVLRIKLHTRIFFYFEN